MTPTQRIVEWNRTRGLLEQGYDAERESAFILDIRSEQWKLTKF